MTHGRNGNGVTHDMDILLDETKADDGPLVVDRTPPSRPVDPEVDRLIAAGKRATEWRAEARDRLHRLMRRLVKMGGTEDDAIAVLEGEAQRWLDRRERRKRREAGGVVGAKP